MWEAQCGEVRHAILEGIRWMLVTVATAKVSEVRPQSANALGRSVVTEAQHGDVAKPWQQAERSRWDGGDGGGNGGWGQRPAIGENIGAQITSGWL